MRFATFQAADRAIGRLLDALTDPARRERTAVLTLLAYAVVWTLYGVIAKSSQGLHTDMAEQIAWSRDLSLGYLKHPPLAAWIVRAWFSVFPVTESSFYLLAMLMPATALWFAWLVSADYLDIEKRVVGLALLTLIPFFNFHALKFNVNTVLMPLWAATTFWFLRSYTTRSRVYAALTGVGAAACMLGKYWSVFLLAGLAVAALIDRRRAAYFRSAAPWIAIAAGLVVLAPHLIWLVHNDFAPFIYAMTVHGDKPPAATVLGALGYFAGSAGYVALPVILVLAATRPSRAALADMAWPAGADRQLVTLAFWAPLLIPAVAAMAIGIEITSLWSMSAWTLLPVVLLSSPMVTLSRAATRKILGLAVAVPFVMLVAAPAIAISIHRAGVTAAAGQSELLAAEVERVWHETTAQPLRFVGGDAEIAYGVIAYAQDRPRALPGLPPQDDARLKRSGVALVCYADDEPCVRDAAGSAATNPTSRRIDAEIVRQHLGYTGRPHRYTIVIVPPRP
jgi:4-amino-4-deoxy-L-arabinose transferase-like glycosyltransferase